MNSTGSHFADKAAAQRAVDMALPMIEPAMRAPGVCGSGFLVIVVMDPALQPGDCPFDDAVLVEHALDGGPGKPEKKPAVTRLLRLGTGELAVPSAQHPTSRYALVLCSPHTGRYRQIRRHLKHLHHHLVGDSSHGDGRHNRAFRMLGVHRMLLHAWRLRFAHPLHGGMVDVVAPPDAEFRRALDLLGLALPDPAEPSLLAA